MMNFYHSVHSNLSWDKTGQIIYIPSLSYGIVQKISLCITLLRRLAGLVWSWCQNITCSCLSLAYSIAEYCGPVWCYNTHTCLIATVLNGTLCIVTGYLCLTSMDHQTILLGIQPAELSKVMFSWLAMALSTLTICYMVY